MVLAATRAPRTDSPTTAAPAGQERRTSWAAAQPHHCPGVVKNKSPKAFWVEANSSSSEFGSIGDLCAG
eukprot:3073597-Pyramimonas_sp.AAC.1